MSESCFWARSGAMKSSEGVVSEDVVDFVAALAV